MSHMLNVYSPPLTITTTTTTTTTNLYLHLMGGDEV
jgi:hypothetical protein